MDKLTKETQEANFWEDTNKANSICALLNSLKKELEQYGSTIMLSYGGGSIKTNGIYTQIIEILQSAGKTIIDDGGVMPNPTVEKMYDGAKKVREHSVDFKLLEKLYDRHTRYKRYIKTN